MKLQAPIPKQYLELLGQPIAIYSLQIFASMPEVTEMVIVCNSDYRSLHQRAKSYFSHLCKDVAWGAWKKSLHVYISNTSAKHLTGQKVTELDFNLTNYHYLRNTVPSVFISNEERKCQAWRRDLFQQHYDKLPRKPKLTFAEPGSERQDSVYNGFQVSINFL